MPLNDQGFPAPSLIIRLFGPFDARRDGRRLPRFRSRKGQWLLALLTLRHGRDLDRARLAGLLWPDSAEPQALANLRISLTDLRQALGPEARRLHAPTPRTLSLDLSGADVDVVRFDAAVASGDPQQMEAAVALYRGALLEGCVEEWAFQERQAREQTYLAVLERLAATAKERGDAAAAERYLRQLLAVDPTRETAQRALLETLAGSGNYAGMILAYRQLRAHLHRELNAEPDVETRTLFSRLRAEARGTKAHSARLTAHGPDPNRLNREPCTVSREPPIGTVTFLFTDIESSTRRWEQHPEAMRGALARHDGILRHTIENQYGHVFKTVGDAFCAAFGTAADAVEAALAVQRRLQREEWGEVGTIRVRMALHTGAAEMREGDYFGPVLNRTERLLETGHGGQVLLSSATQELVWEHLPQDASLLPLGSHRLRDLHRPEEIYQLTHPDLTSAFPPLRTLNLLPHNLPQQVTSFIGREQEMAAVKRLLESTRLLTLTGPGGTGKSRLALQVAADLLETQKDGVWLIELAPLSDPALVPTVVASVLSIVEQPDTAAMQSVIGALKSKRLLLILDNCEHLLTACAELAEALLRHCPEVRLLATSREGLNIPGETTYRLPTLSLPDPPSVVPLRQPLNALAAITQHEAVRLFIDRATAAAPSFTVTQQNAPAVVQVCRRLDGIPLAIELAAARIKALPVEKISERLDDRFRLLTSGTRTAPPRQQTLRALIDWSYDLLTDAERTLLRRLSVFSGGWSLEAAEAVCSGATDESSRDARMPERLHADEVLDLLSSLVEKSLIQYEARDGEGRYRLLETVRQYGEERLRETGEAELVRQWHFDWFVEWAERVEPELFGPHLIQWIARLTPELDNLRAALDWSGEHSAEAGLRLASAFGIFWIVCGHSNEAQERILELLSRLAPGEARAARAKALIEIGVMAFLQGNYERSKAAATESLPLARELGRPIQIARSLLHLGVCSIVERDLVRATALFQECLALAREQGERWLVGMTLNAMGYGAMSGDDLERAERCLDESLAVLRGLGNTWMLKFPLINLITLALKRSDLERVAALSIECLLLERAIGDLWGIAVSLDRMALAAAARRRLKRSVRLSAAAVAILEHLQARFPFPIKDMHEQTMAALRESLGPATFDAAWTEGRAMTPEQAIGYALEESGPPDE